MALSINATVLQAGITGDSGTASGTITTTGSGVVGYVGIGCSRFASGSMAVTWGGFSMTLVEDRWNSPGNCYAALFRLIDPPTAASSIAWTGGSSSIGGIIAFSAQGNHQTVPTGTTAEGDTNVLIVPSATGEIAIVANFMYTGSTPSVDSPAQMIGTFGLGGFNGSVAQSAGISPNTTVTFTSGLCVGASLKPLSGGTTVGGTNYFTRLIASSQI